MSDYAEARKALERIRLWPTVKGEAFMCDATVAERTRAELRRLVDRLDGGALLAVLLLVRRLAVGTGERAEG